MGRNISDLMGKSWGIRWVLSWSDDREKIAV